MANGWIAAALLVSATEAQAEQGKPESYLPKEILQACPAPQKIAPNIRGCTTNFVAVEWAKSCSLALDKLTTHANSLLQKNFAAEAAKAQTGQSANFGNTSADLALARLSLEQLITAGKMFMANQKAYQSMVAYPGGENKNLIHSLGMTHVYTAFRCVKSAVDAVGAEIAATERKLVELQKGNAAAAKLWNTSERRDESLSGSLNPVRKPAATGAPANIPAAKKQAPGGNTITGVDKALEEKRKAEQLLQKR